MTRSEHSASEKNSSCNSSHVFRVFKKSSPNSKVGRDTEIVILQSSTRCFQITCYLGKRDFIDYMDHIDPIGRLASLPRRRSTKDSVDGVVLVDPEYVKDRKVFASVLAGKSRSFLSRSAHLRLSLVAFRYGREDLDVLGLTFRKDLFCSTQQIFPPIDDQKKPLTHLQQRLLRKLGPNAYPFYFEVSDHVH